MDSLIETLWLICAVFVLIVAAMLIWIAQLLGRIGQLEHELEKTRNWYSEFEDRRLGRRQRVDK